MVFEPFRADRRHTGDLFDTDTHYGRKRQYHWSVIRNETLLPSSPK
jgi:hypothetical protein